MAIYINVNPIQTGIFVIDLELGWGVGCVVDVVGEPKFWLVFEYRRIYQMRQSIEV